MSGKLFGFESVTSKPTIVDVGTVLYMGVALNGKAIQVADPTALLQLLEDAHAMGKAEGITETSELIRKELRLFQSNQRAHIKGDATWVNQSSDSNQ